MMQRFRVDFPSWGAIWLTLCPHPVNDRRGQHAEVGGLQERLWAPCVTRWSTCVS